MPPRPRAAVAPASAENASPIARHAASASIANATKRRRRRAIRPPVASWGMDLERLCSASRVVIVAGKGGVGKTTVSAALAVAAARTGASVLIVEVEGKSGLSACFGRAPLEYDEGELSPGVRARTLSADLALLEYLGERGMRRLSRRLVNSG